MKKPVAEMIGLVLMVLACSATAAQIDLTSVGVTTYGHNYTTWGSPLSFSGGDMYKSSGIGFGASGENGPSIVFENNGYAIYKFVASAGTTISSLDLFVKSYFDTGSETINVYYSTANISSTATPDFSSSDWNKLTYGSAHYYYTNPTAMTFAPGNNVVYLAYAGLNNGASWQLQVTRDEMDITVVPEPATVGLLALGLAVFFGRKNKVRG